MLIACRAAYLLFSIFSFTLIFIGSKSEAQQGDEFSNQTGFSIYCNSNMDGTGNCNRSDNGNPLLCIMIPGQSIDCSDQNKQEFDCVQYGAVLPLQTQFFCIPEKSKSIEEPMIDSKGPKIPTLSLRAIPFVPMVPQENNRSTFKNPFTEYNGNSSSPQQGNFQNAF